MTYNLGWIEYLPGLANWHVEKFFRSIRLNRFEAFFICSSVARDASSKVT